ALFVATLVVIAAENGDKGDRGGSSDEEIGDHVGELEGGIEGVGVSTASEEPGDVFDADQSNHARKHGRSHEQQRGTEYRVAVRRAQKRECSLPAWRAWDGGHADGLI